MGGIAASTSPPPTPWWSWARPAAKPTVAFEATRTLGQGLTFVVLAALGLLGTFSMPRRGVNGLAAAMATVAAATCILVCSMMYSAPTDGDLIASFGLVLVVALVVVGGSVVGFGLAVV